MPALTYVGQTAQSVSVTYTDMPTGAETVFVNDTSGAKTPAANVALSGSGSADISVPGLSAGQYHLQAQKAGQYLARTVKFYIN
jgi:hypothetical protein